MDVIQPSKYADELTSSHMSTVQVTLAVDTRSVVQETYDR